MRRCGGSGGDGQKAKRNGSNKRSEGHKTQTTESNRVRSCEGTACVFNGDVHICQREDSRYVCEGPGKDRGAQSPHKWCEVRGATIGAIARSVRESGRCSLSPRMGPTLLRRSDVRVQARLSVRTAHQCGLYWISEAGLLGAGSIRPRDQLPLFVPDPLWQLSNPVTHGNDQFQPICNAFK